MPLITEVLKPEQLTAEKLLFLKNLPHIPEETELDAMQRVLDGLVEDGILGTS